MRLRYHCRVCDQESSTQDGDGAKCSQVHVLMSGLIPPMICFESFTGNILIKRKMFPFFQCHLSLTRILVSFVHRPLKVEKVFAEYIEGDCGVDFVCISINRFPLLMYYWYQNHLQINIVRCSIVFVSLICRKSRNRDEKSFKTFKKKTFFLIFFFYLFGFLLI